MRRALAVLAAAAALAGCHRSERSRAQCQHDASELATWLAQVHAEGGGLSPPSDLELVERPGLGAPGYGTLIEVLPDRTLLGGRPVEGAALAAALQPEVPTLLQLGVDQRTPWSRLVELAGRLRDAGVMNTALLFTRKTTLVPPPASSIDGQLDALASVPVPERASGVAGVAVKLIAKCPAMRELFKSLSPLPPAEKADTVVKGTQAALVACGCDVDLAGLRQLHWRLLGPSAGGMVASSLAFTLAPDTGIGSVVRLPGATPWSKANDDLVSAAARGPVTLQVE